MAKQPALGSGARFAKLAASLAEKPGVTDPEELDASIGRRKFGAARFQKMSTAGKKRTPPTKADMSAMMAKK